MSYKTVAYGLTHEQKLQECTTGFSAQQAAPNAPNMTTLMKVSIIKCSNEQAYAGSEATSYII